MTDRDSRTFSEMRLKLGPLEVVLTRGAAATPIVDDQRDAAATWSFSIPGDEHPAAEAANEPEPVEAAYGA